MSIHKKSVWKTIPKKQYPEHNGDRTVDVAIVGGGLTGLIAAYLLCLSGKTVVLLESDQIGAVASGLTTGFLIETIDTSSKESVRFFGQEKAKKVFISHREAIDWYEQVIEREGIEAEFKRCPFYQYVIDEKDRKVLKEESFYAERLGVQLLYGEVPLGSFGGTIYTTLNHQAKFHPLKFLYALAEIVEKNGVKIFEHTEIEDIEEKDNVLLKHKEGTIQATHVLVATHYPEIEGEQPLPLFFKKGKYITYVLELQIPNATFPEGLYEDTENPYHYFRVDSMTDGDRLIIGGEDHRADIPISEEKNFAALKEYMQNLLGNVPYTLIKQWKGPIIEPGDGLAYIGTLRPDSHVFYATGYSGNGLTYAVIAAQIFAEAVMGRQHEYASLYQVHRPLRPHFVKAWSYVSELFNGVIKNWFMR